MREACAQKFRDWVSNFCGWGPDPARAVAWCHTYRKNAFFKSSRDTSVNRYHTTHKPVVEASSLLSQKWYSLQRVWPRQTRYIQSSTYDEGFFKLAQWFFSPPLVDVQPVFAKLKLVKETLEAFTLKGSGTLLYYLQHNPSQAHFQVSTTINITNQTQTIIQHQVMFIFSSSSSFPPFVSPAWRGSNITTSHCL